MSEKIFDRSANLVSFGERLASSALSRICFAIGMAPVQRNGKPPSRRPGRQQSKKLERTAALVCVCYAVHHQAHAACILGPASPRVVKK